MVNVVNSLTSYERSSTSVAAMRDKGYDSCDCISKSKELDFFAEEKIIQADQNYYELLDVSVSYKRKRQRRELIGTTRRSPSTTNASIFLWRR